MKDLKKKKPTRLGQFVGGQMRFSHASAAVFSRRAQKAASAAKASQKANNKAVQARGEQNYANSVCARNPGSSSCKKAGSRAKKASKSAAKANGKAAEKWRKTGAAAAKKGNHGSSNLAYDCAQKQAKGISDPKCSKKSSKGGSKGGVGISVGVSASSGGYRPGISTSGGYNSGGRSAYGPGSFGHRSAMPPPGGGAMMTGRPMMPGGSMMNQAPGSFGYQPPAGVGTGMGETYQQQWQQMAPQGMMGMGGMYGAGF